MSTATARAGTRYAMHLARSALRDGGTAEATVGGIPLVVSGLAVRDGRICGLSDVRPTVGLADCDDVPGDLRLVRAAGPGREVSVRIAGWWQYGAAAGGGPWRLHLEAAFATVETHACPCGTATAGAPDDVALRLDDEDVELLLSRA